MKKKLFITVLSVVALLLLAGVGYATWIISQNMEEESQGKIVVETVNDERLVVTIAPKTDGVDKFVFGHPTGATSGWLTSDGTDPEELLYVDFTVEVKKKGNVAFSGTDDITITPHVTDLAAEAAPFMQDFDFTLLGSLTFKEGSDNKIITGTYRATIDWGTLTGGDNPYVYFNGLGDSDAKITAAMVTAANAAITGAALTTDSTNADFALAYLEFFATTYNNADFFVQVEVTYNQ